MCAFFSSCLCVVSAFCALQIVIDHHVRIGMFRIIINDKTAKLDVEINVDFLCMLV